MARVVVAVALATVFVLAVVSTLGIGAVLPAVVALWAGGQLVKRYGGPADAA